MLRRQAAQVSGDIAVNAVQRTADARHGWAPHYLIFPALALGCFASLRLTVLGRANLALLLLSFVIGLYGAEVVLGQVVFSPVRFSMNDWLNFPEDANSSVAVNGIKEEKSNNAAFDSRTRLEVVKDLRKQGIAAFPDVFPTVLFQSNGKGVIRSLFTSEGGEFLPLEMRAVSTSSTVATTMVFITYPVCGSAG
jgi:hypothetical protein